MALDLVRAAQQSGHTLALGVREFPEYDVPPKFYVTCSCGHQAKVARSMQGANSNGARHLRWALAHSRAS